MAVIGNIERAKQDSADRAEAVKRVLNDYQANTARLLENERQKTDEIIENQEEQTRIMCILFRIGTTANQLSPEDRQLIIDRCEAEIEGYNNPTAETEARPQGTPTPAQPPQSRDNNLDSSSNRTPQRQPAQPDNSQPEQPEEPEEPQGSGVLESLGNTVNNIINTIGGIL